MISKNHRSKIFFFTSLFFLLSFFASDASAAKIAVLLNINGAIGPATQDYVVRGIEHAKTQQAQLIILTLDTPGGLDLSMRGINQAILTSTIPVIAYVSPSGARAASAGTYILYASHIAAMAPGTNLGAATPVSIGEIPSPDNKKTSEKSPVMNKKATNDAIAYIRSLAEIRGRNAEWAENAVKDAASISAETALKLKVIDLIAPNTADLLKKVNGKPVKIQNTTANLQTNDLTIETIKPNWRFQFLSIITDPSIAYILLLIGIYGLFFEFYNPGFVLPGVVGGIALLLALYAFQLMPVNYIGFALLILGIAFMIIEVFVASFGVLGIGGIVAFIVGSIFLLDTDTPGFRIAWQLIVTATLISVGFFLMVISLTIQSLRKKIVSGREALIGAHGRVLEHKNKNYLIKIGGEIWEAHSLHSLKYGETVRVTKLTDLLLEVEPVVNDKK